MPNTIKLVEIDHVREKLIELLRDVQYLGGLEEKIADHLIANGVTIQKWIPVSERLPKPITDVLSYRGHRNLMQEDCVDKKGKWYSEYKYDGANVTHWMPLPEPPKEGE
jgi:hypothetical protein